MRLAKSVGYICYHSTMLLRDSLSSSVYLERGGEIEDIMAIDNSVSPLCSLRETPLQVCLRAGCWLTLMSEHDVCDTMTQCNIYINSALQLSVLKCSEFVLPLLVSSSHEFSVVCQCPFWAFSNNFMFVYNLKSIDVEHFCMKSME